MYSTIAQMLVQDHQHELAVEAAGVRLAATAKAASMNRRHSDFSPAAILMAVILLATGPLLAACSGSGATSTHPAMPPGGSQDAAQLFEGACASCHGPRGEGGLSGVPLEETATDDRQQVIAAIRNGVGRMPASSGGLSDEQLKALADYVAGLRN